MVVAYPICRTPSCLFISLQQFLMVHTGVHTVTRTLHRLTDTAARSTQLKAGRLSDGGGLYLNVKDTGAKSWIFLFTSGGKRRAIGLGPYPDVSLAAARKKASELRKVRADGGDPKSALSTRLDPTFADCVDEYLKSIESQWRNDKHRAQWRMTLGPSYCNAILHKKVGAIGTEDVLQVLTPIWNTKAETASRLRGRIERVLDFARARGWRTGENPAMWRGHLKSILPARQKLARGHHAALPYVELPAFIAELRARASMAARALEFLILTAARSGEVLGARWDELDLDKAVWTIPAVRMKAGRAHRVPLSSPSIAILEALATERTSNFVFPGQKDGKPLSAMSMEMQLRRMNRDDITVHGFRSCFRDWAGEETLHAREIAEAALAHVVGDATERAYRRSDALEKRRQLMEDWAAFIGRF